MPIFLMDHLVVGRITSAFGIKGWLKVYSYTEPLENIMGYPTLFIRKMQVKKVQAGQQDWQAVTFDQWQAHSKGLIAHIPGCDDRNSAERYTGMEIGILETELPKLEADDYYWHQLLGLKVFSQFAGKQTLLGRVHELLETGANDVLVVRACEGSVDKRERLIPYLPKSVVVQVDSAAGVITVDWDPDF